HRHGGGVGGLQEARLDESVCSERDRAIHDCRRFQKPGFDLSPRRERWEKYGGAGRPRGRPVFSGSPGPRARQPEKKRGGPTDLLPMNPISIGHFGLHPNMPELVNLFNLQKLAVVCNVGTLVQPTTRTTFRNGTAKRPYQLFSHSDQVEIYQTGIASTQGNTGWGGRMAD